MTSTNVRSRMIHRTTIQRDSAGFDDTIGVKEVPTWADHLTDQPCFFYTSTGREIIQDRAVVISNLHMLLPLGADVTEKDRIDGVEDRQGVPIYSGFFQIRSVLPHQHHLELDLVRPS